MTAKFLNLKFVYCLAIISISTADYGAHNQYNNMQIQNQNMAYNSMSSPSYGSNFNSNPNYMQKPYMNPVGASMPNGQMQVEVLALYERDPVLLLTNRYRRHLAKARVSGASRQNFAHFQGAQRMYKLTWDVLLEDKARYLASFCQQMPQSNEYRNVHMSSSRAAKKDLLVEAAKQWWGEMLSNNNQININLPIQFNDSSHTNIKNWKNMAASFMTRMGCAVNMCGQNNNSLQSVVVCLYAHDVMNVPETLVFTPGPGCLHDADCSTYAGSTCKSAFCISENNELPQEVEEEFRGDILYEMNKLRRDLAHGKLIQNQNRVHSASNMYKLEWARDLEERAQSISLQCQAAVFDAAINNDLGHNLYIDPGVTHDDDFKKRGNILEQAIHKWWNTVDRNSLENQCPQGQEEQCYAHMQEFVNMAYYRATEVGCAVNHDCNNHSVVICFFRKGGQDIIGHPIYPHGKPCNEDRHCTEYGDSWCETHTGLCVDAAKGKARRYVQPIRQGLKRSVVDRQNSIRQRVIARLGEINNGPCRPTGKDFYKLHWNNNLEQRALEIASWCRKERRVNYKYIGENYFVSTDMDSHSDPRKLLKQAFRNWMHESETNALPNLDDSEKRDMCINYNNMLYGGYVNVACAINHCNDQVHQFSLVVCLFQRGKSVPSTDLKVPFTQSCLNNNNSCTTYHNSTCEQNSGLCKINGHERNMFLNNNNFHQSQNYGVVPSSYTNDNFGMYNQPNNNYNNVPYSNNNANVRYDNNGQPINDNNFGGQSPYNAQAPYNQNNQMMMNAGGQPYNNNQSFNDKVKFGRRHNNNYPNNDTNNTVANTNGFHRNVEGDIDDGTDVSN